MSDQPPKWSWTDKLPLILAGLGLVATGIFFLFRKCWWLGIILIAVGSVALWYGEQIGDWCLPNDPHFSPAYNFQFYHHSLSSCFRLVYEGSKK
jgi:hypothetical protein